MTQATKRCPRCGQTLPVSYFSRNKAKTSGLKDRCKRCSKETVRERRSANPVGVWALHAVYSARARADKHGVPFNISREYIEASAPEFCPVLGIKLNYAGGRGSGGRDDSPTLDKTVPHLGYVQGNVVVMSHLANRIKSNATADQIQRVADYVRANNGDQN